MRLVVVRHAEPEDGARGRCYGSLDVWLSDRGRRQAVALAVALASERPAAVLSSPARRALDTAAPIAAAHGLSVELANGLRELDFGELEGRTYDEIAASLPELYGQWMTEPTTVRFPGGESYADLRARVVAWLDVLATEHAGETVVAVTHGGVVRAALAHVLGIPDANVFRLAVDPASITVVEWLDAEPVVRVLNDTAAIRTLP